MEKETISKFAIYGGNFVAGLIGKRTGYDIGNPIGAIVYGGLEFAREAVPDSKVIRLAEAVGTGLYAFKTVSNLVGILGGDLNSMARLPFNVGMLYEIGKNTVKDYKDSGSSIGKDIIGVKDNLFVDFPDFLRRLTH